MGEKIGIIILDNKKIPQVQLSKQLVVLRKISSDSRFVPVS